MKRALLLGFLLLVYSTASANPLIDPYVAGTINQVGSGTSVSVTVPTAAQGWHVGDCFVLLCSTSAGSQTITESGGWSSQASHATAGVSWNAFYKYAAASTLGSTQTCSAGTAGTMVAVLAGVQQTYQSSGCLFSLGATEWGTATAQTGNSVGTGAGNDIDVSILQVSGTTAVTWNHMNNSIFGSMNDWAQTSYAYVASVPQPTPNTTGISSSTISSSSLGGVGVAFLFRPQVAATPTPTATPTPKGTRSMYVE